MAKTTRNLGCALAFDDDVNSIDATFAPAEDDPHSSTLFRALAIENDRKGTVPKQCSAFLSYSQPAHRPLTCQ